MITTELLEGNLVLLINLTATRIYGTIGFSVHCLIVLTDTTRLDSEPVSQHLNFKSSRTINIESMSVLTEMTLETEVSEWGGLVFDFNMHEGSLSEVPYEVL